MIDLNIVLILIFLMIHYFYLI